MNATDPVSIPDWMIIDAVRYAMGRHNYQAATTSAWLVKHWDQLSAMARHVIQSDIEGVFAMEQEMCVIPDYCGILSDDVIRPYWETVRKLWSI